jgi:type IV pilus assembly protein PilX
MRLARHHFLAMTNERGFSLIVSLMMLIVIIILGISASQMAVNEERGSRADRDRQIAFQAAEAALKDAELEILGPPPPTTVPNCAYPGQTARGWGRMISGTLTLTCFNQINAIGFTTSALSPCSGPPNAGLCPYDELHPAWRRSATDATLTHIDFVADAKQTGSMSTAAYGQFTGQTYGAQNSASGAPTSFGSSATLPIYPPRYIIEQVPLNTSTTAKSQEGGSGLCPCMFRVTAMGFGTSINTQVVLQTVIATKD